MKLLGNSDSEFLTPKKWVRLLFEPDTGIESIKDCVSTNDITGDGDHKLVIVDFAETQCRLKLLKGLNFMTDAHLPDEPAGVVTFYSEDSQMPCVAVAIGNSLLIYRNMKPYYRCNVEPVDLNPSEISLWNAAMEKQIGVSTLVEGLTGTPDKIVCIGEFDSEWRLFVAIREGDCTILRKKPSNSNILRTNLNLRNYVTAICQTQTQIVIACRNNQLIFSIIDLEAFHYRPRLYSGALVAFRNRIDLYIDGQVIDTLKFDCPIKWLKYGKMGREEAVLIVGHKDTAIGLHVFRRTAVLENSKQQAGPPDAQTRRMNVPKKTKIYVEQCIRERENTSRIFTTYQRDLFMLRLQISRSFAEMTNKNAGMLPTKDSEKLDVNLELNGFGPNFRINLTITPSMELPFHKRWIAFSYDKNEYKMDADLIPLSRIISNATMSYTNSVECENRKAPLWMTKFEMPVSEQSFV
uniref:Bardet-Biedl syndrome 1 N-terminal domain-containing protein n=1 Tax=Panagrolaimus superbus TaxID=310955 RepID=A0A914XYE6_9BILA